MPFERCIRFAALQKHVRGADCIARDIQVARQPRALEYTTASLESRRLYCVRPSKKTMHLLRFLQLRLHITWVSCATMRGIHRRKKKIYLLVKKKSTARCVARGTVRNASPNAPHTISGKKPKRDLPSQEQTARASCTPPATSRPAGSAG